MAEFFNSIKTLFTDEQRVLGYGISAIKVILIIIIAKFLTYIGSVIIDKFFHQQKQYRFAVNKRKADTLSELLKSIMKYAVYIIAIISILEQIGIETRTLLVGAGVGGLAISFGAQSLIKDIITGFFILFEDQFSVGEYVEIDGMSGIVEAVGLRITKIKGFAGQLHIIPNGQIAKVTNYSRDNMRALVEVQVGYDVNIDRALQVLKGVAESMKKDMEEIVDGPNILGVSAFGESGVTITVVATTKPMAQWGVERELRKRIKESFDREKINISYPTRVIVTKSGNN